MKKKYFLIPLILLTAIACSQKKQQENAESREKRQQLYEDVMAVHDEAMPYMQDIRNYKNTIAKKIDSISKSGANVSEANALNRLAGELDAADKAMMNWMHSFGEGYAQMDDSTAVAYLEDQKARATAVKKEMEAALQKAKEALQ